MSIILRQKHVNLLGYLIFANFRFSVHCLTARQWKLFWITWPHVNLEEPAPFRIAHHLGKLFTTGKTAIERIVLCACLWSKITTNQTQIINPAQWTLQVRKYKKSIFRAYNCSQVVNMMKCDETYFSSKQLFCLVKIRWYLQIHNWITKEMHSKVLLNKVPEISKRKITQTQTVGQVLDLLMNIWKKR